MQIKVLTAAIRTQVESAQFAQANAQTAAGFTAATIAYSAMSSLTRDLAKSTEDPRAFAIMCGLPTLRL